MKNIFLTLTFLFSIAACAGPTIYGKPDNNVEQERKDFTECKYEAMKATGSAPSGSFSQDAATTVANDINTGIRINELMKMCLEVKGYSPQ